MLSDFNAQVVFSSVFHADQVKICSDSFPALIFSHPYDFPLYCKYYSSTTSDLHFFLVENTIVSQICTAHVYSNFCINRFQIIFPFLCRLQPN